MKFKFIAHHQHEFPVGRMCQRLKVARSSYYAYTRSVHQEPSKREQDNARLLERIKVIFEKSKQRYGSPSVHAELKRQGESCSLGRVKRLMRHAGLYEISHKKYKLKQEKGEVIATKNLLLKQDNKPTAINQVWHSTSPVCQPMKAGCTWQVSWMGIPSTLSVTQWLNIGRQIW